MGKNRFKLIVCSVLVLIFAATSSAQERTNGAISGLVLDKQSNQGLSGATVVITSISRKNEVTAVTDNKGSFTVTSLLPGEYTLLFVYGEAQSILPKVQVTVGRTAQVRAKIDGSLGEVLTIQGRPPSIDTLKTKQGVVLDRKFLRNAPIGRTIVGALRSVPGAIVNDDGQVSFGGAAANENQYNIDGINTSNTDNGAIDNSVNRYFVEALEVITGGYSAEYGRSTGAQVNAVTRSGTNEFTGSVSLDFTNSFLQLGGDRFDFGDFIAEGGRTSYDLGMAATLGGPIIKDKLWFFVGIEPQLEAREFFRSTRQRTDCHQILPSGELSECKPGSESEGGFSDGIPDQDINGNTVYRDLDRSVRSPQSQSYQFLTKVNYSPNAQHNAYLSFLGGPRFADEVNAVGEVQATDVRRQELATDLSAGWTSKFNNDKTTVDALLGLHRISAESGSIRPKADVLVQQDITGGNFANLIAGNNQFSGETRESMLTIAGCEDGTARDEFPDIVNCPFGGNDFYTIGGPGALQDLTEKRLSAKVSVTQRFSMLGNHELKVGTDIEENSRSVKGTYSGGALIFNDIEGDYVNVTRYIGVASDGDAGDLSNYNAQCNRTEAPIDCSLTPLNAGVNRSLNTAAFVQDTWRIRSNLTANLGLRYGEQRLRTPDHLVGSKDREGNTVGKNALVLKDMWAPRLGIIYDWTKEGRSKVYSSWGRYFESVPLAVTGILFGGDLRVQSSDYQASACGNTSPDELPLVEGLGGVDGRACMANFQGRGALTEEFIQGGVSSALVVDNLQAQYIDEAIVGADYEIVEGVVLSLVYKNSTLNRALEDMSIDNTQTFVLGNPGVWSAEEEAALVARIDSESDLTKKAELESQLENFRGIRLFDRARRIYNNLQFSVAVNRTDNFWFKANYNFSSTRGNFGSLGEGFFKISTTFDGRDTMANTYGDLGQDLRHQIGLDTSYRFDFGRLGSVTTGANMRVASGAPLSVYGKRPGSGSRLLRELFLLPRGSAGRGPVDYSARLRAAYWYQFASGVGLSLYAELRNIQAFGFLAGQRPFLIDEIYSQDPTGVIVGGRREDLLYLKALSENNRTEAANPQVAARRSRFLKADDQALIFPFVSLGAALEF